MNPRDFPENEAAFLAGYRQLCELHGMCLVAEDQGKLALVDFSENRIWGCTAGQMVDMQVGEMAGSPHN
jgi:hypothetical protein